jgi:Rap1a immunity proteins
MREDGMSRFIRKIQRFLAAAVLSILPVYSNAETTGNALHEWCNSTESAFQALCTVYIEASVRGQQTGATIAGLVYFNLVAMEISDEKFGVLKSMTIGRALDYCVPTEATGNQLDDVVKKYLFDHPELRHEAGDSLIYRALRDGFPCATP